MMKMAFPAYFFDNMVSGPSGSFVLLFRLELGHLPLVLSVQCFCKPSHGDDCRLNVLFTALPGIIREKGAPKAITTVPSLKTLNKSCFSSLDPLRHELVDAVASVLCGQQERGFDVVGCEENISAEPADTDVPQEAAQNHIPARRMHRRPLCLSTCP